MVNPLHQEILDTLWTMTAFFGVVGIVMLIVDILFPENEEPPFP